MRSAQASLLWWYKKHGRKNLPWRQTDSIYHIYLSEVMLQQTQVNRVKEEYYPNFLEKFPNLKALQKASLEEVLALWSGLGYYSRANNLHKCAKSIEEFPKSKEELLKLPGIGDYTASAICSFGYRQPVVVIDTNIKRVLKRFFALTQEKESSLKEKGEKLLNKNFPREHNLALMDLGSLICTPKNPQCALCPLKPSCKGANDPETYTQTKKKTYENLDLFLGVYMKNKKIALVKSKGSMYKNMLELPSCEVVDEDFLGEFNHSYTKYRLKVSLFKLHEFLEECLWLDIEKLNHAPISSLTKKALKLLGFNIE